MTHINRDLKRSYVFGGVSVIGFTVAVIILTKTEINPLVWFSILFALFLLLSYAGVYQPKITCSNCSSNLYKAEERAFKKTKMQNALKQCPECGAAFEYSESAT